MNINDTNFAEIDDFLNEIRNGLDANLSNDEILKLIKKNLYDKSAYIAQYKYKLVLNEIKQLIYDVYNENNIKISNYSHIVDIFDNHNRCGLELSIKITYKINDITIKLSCFMMQNKELQNSWRYEIHLDEINTEILKRICILLPKYSEKYWNILKTYFDEPDQYY